MDKQTESGNFPKITPEKIKFEERGVAQLGSAGALGALGRRFESCRPDWFFGDLELGLGPHWALLND